MELYKNLNGDSDIREFEIGNDCIVVKFEGGSIYRYSYRIAGIANVEEAKRFARIGNGLGHFIMKNMRKLYDPNYVIRR